MKKAIATVTIVGISNYSQCTMCAKTDSDIIDKREDSKLDKEWRAALLKRVHFNPDGFVIVPQMAIHKALVGGAKFKGDAVPGKGKKQYAGFFQSSLMIPEPFVTNCKAEDVKWEPLMLDGQPGKGASGAGTRVLKRMPYLSEGWQAKGDIWVLEPAVIREQILRDHIEAAGIFVGIGRFRPSTTGFYGRFQLKDLKWVE